MSVAFLIRPEEPGDESAIRLVTERAFAGRPYADGNEQDIIEVLRELGALTVSLVAVSDEQIVGHVAFTPAVVKDSAAAWFTLGPVSVDPTVQRLGIGKALIRDGLARLRAQGAAGCIVLGDTQYYGQFGFEPAPELAPAGAPAEHFMVLSLGGEVPTSRMDFHEAFYRN